MTISDIAKLANVSKSAVSFVLNNKPGVSEQTRKKVLEIVKKYNFNPNQLAQSLVAKKTKSIGLLVTEIDNPFFTKVMRGVYDTCSNAGFSVLIGSSELSPEKEQEAISTFKSKQIDGIIVSPLSGEKIDYQYINDFKSTNTPFVMLRNVQNHSINLVDIDNKKAAYDAVNYLVKLGHKKIVYFSGPVHSGHSFERLQGYENALIENNIPVDYDLVIKTGSYMINGYETAKKFINENKNLPTAIFCYNDLVALGLLSYLEDAKIAVPDSISVMGFDNIDFSKYIKTPLTTINMPAYEIGKTATELLLKQINNPKESFSERNYIEAQLVERASCKKVSY